MNIAEIQIHDLELQPQYKSPHDAENVNFLVRINLVGSGLGLSNCSLEFRLQNAPEGDIYLWVGQQIENAGKELRNLSRNLQDD